MNNKEFSEKLIAWYIKNHRNLPWRNTRDPFKIWLSEVILQQTRVAQGLPYYQQFTENFGKVEELAAASEQQVLRLWQGLGYYSRARNLHRCAQVVVEEFGGTFPAEYQSLLKLPGIGKYTAAAVASFAFKQRVPVIDGNVYRVLARVFGIDADIADTKGQKVFETWAGKLIPSEQPDIYNQAIMEFGAIQCTPKDPACDNCIFNIECYARANKMQNKLPLKSRRVKVKSRFMHYLVLRVAEKTAMKKREKKDIWQGLYDYLMIEKEEFCSVDGILRHEVLQPLTPYITQVEVSRDYKHVLTHQKLYARFITIDLEPGDHCENILKDLNLALFDNESVYHLPKPVLVSRYLNDTIF